MHVLTAFCSGPKADRQESQDEQDNEGIFKIFYPRKIKERQDDPKVWRHNQGGCSHAQEKDSCFLGILVKEAGHELEKCRPVQEEKFFF